MKGVRFFPKEDIFVALEIEVIIPVGRFSATYDL